MKKKRNKEQMTIPCIEDEDLRWKIKEFCGKNHIYLKDFVYTSIVIVANERGIITDKEADTKLMKALEF